jgi:hypothetical protein
MVLPVAVLKYELFRCETLKILYYFLRFDDGHITHSSTIAQFLLNFRDRFRIIRELLSSLFALHEQ